MVINVNLNYEFVKLYVKIPAFADVMATASTFYSIGSIKLVSPSLKKVNLDFYALQQNKSIIIIAA